MKSKRIQEKFSALFQRATRCVIRIVDILQTVDAIAPYARIAQQIEYTTNSNVNSYEKETLPNKNYLDFLIYFLKADIPENTLKFNLIIAENNVF